MPVPVPESGPGAVEGSVASSATKPIILVTVLPVASGLTPPSNDGIAVVDDHFRPGHVL